MEDLPSEIERNPELLTGEHAVLIPVVAAVKSVLAYVEAVAVVIGSRHIHSVYEDGDNIKVYLNDRRFVDILVNNGISILGRRMNVDYAVPRADKVILSNIDPVVPDSVILKLVSVYGVPVSSIIHEKIATTSEYSHIECGKRKLYMNIFAEKKMPTKIKFSYLEMNYQMDVLIEQCERNDNDVCESTSYDMADRSEDEVNDDLIDVESNQSLKPNISDLVPMKQPTPKQLAYRNRGKTTRTYSASNAARQIKRKARKGWYTVRKLKRVTSARFPSQRGGKPKRLTVNKPTKPIKKGTPKARRGSFAKQKISRASSSNVPIAESDTGLFDDMDFSVDSSGFVDQSSFSNTPSNEPVDGQSISQYPLTVDELEKFMFKTKFHREPLQVALEFLEDKTPEALSALKTQLLEYHNICKETSLKIRIKRLVASLKNSKIEESAE